MRITLFLATLQCISFPSHKYSDGEEPRRPATNCEKKDRPESATEVRFRLHVRHSKWRIEFEKAPMFVHALKMAPAAREPELNRGTWLVLVFAVWSAPDINSIRPAVEAAAGLREKMQVGVRPFVEYEEIKKWFPQYGQETNTPLWIMMHDGQILQWEVGTLSKLKAQNFIKKSLQQKNKRDKSKNPE